MKDEGEIKAQREGKPGERGGNISSSGQMEEGKEGESARKQREDGGV